MVVPVLVRAGTYTCEVVVVVKGAAIDGLIEGVEMRPMEGARVIGLELVEQLTQIFCLVHSRMRLVLSSFEDERPKSVSFRLRQCCLVHLRMRGLDVLASRHGYVVFSSFEDERPMFVSFKPRLCTSK